MTLKENKLSPDCDYMHRLLFLEFDSESVKLFVLSHHYNSKSEETIRTEVRYNPDSQMLHTPFISHEAKEQIIPFLL